MVTDHLLIRRAAGELEAALRGGRVRDVGLTDDGRFAVCFGGKGGGTSLLVDPFGSPPLLRLERDAQPALAAEPAWTRAIGAVLRGLALIGVRARKGDRVIALDFGARSRFGVETASRLILELVPRFGNAVLLKGETIVAAAKTFSPAENQERSVEVGRVYVPPPLPRQTLDRAAFERSLSAGPDAWRKALLGYLPAVPRLVAVALALEAAPLELGVPELADWFESKAAELDRLGERDAVQVYRTGGRLVQAHVVPLLQYADLDHAESTALLPLFAEAASSGPAAGSTQPRPDRLRVRLERGLRRKLDAIDGQFKQLGARRAEIAGRDRLRRAGDALYAHAGEIAAGATRFVPESDPDLEIELDPSLDAKGNAAAYFVRYRKAADAEPHLARRQDELARTRSETETLLWEVERADAQTLAEIAADASGTRAPRRPRKIEAITLASGVRMYVGRSPRENVEITFSLARPNDLWFHARNVPGAHVVLVSPGSEPSESDILAAAAMAARNSRAKGSAKVEVDYTRRKHVRKQRDAGPGMVWYTDFSTVAVAPQAGDQDASG